MHKFEWKNVVMSLQIIILIMVFSGVTGGIINYILPANLNNITFERIQLLFYCILLGLGATILIPLFLELAQSKLLDNIRVSWDIYAPENPQPLKSYFIFAAYCFLAASAGQRFINNLIGGVLKDQQITTLTSQTVTAKKERDQAVEDKVQSEKAKTKLTAQNRLSAKQEEEAVETETGLRIRASGTASATPLRSQIGPVIFPDDPQKGRFGGSTENNGRILKANVSADHVPDFYEVFLWVASTDHTRPLQNDVVFCLPDSFRPAVHIVKKEDFTEGIAGINVLAYGAFTAGAVTDHGETLLELDLALQAEFPKEFTNR